MIENDIIYKLIVICDDEEIYESEFYSQEALQEEGLRKADHAIMRFKEEQRELEETLEETLEEVATPNVGATMYERLEEDLT